MPSVGFVTRRLKCEISSTCPVFARSVPPKAILVDAYDEVRLIYIFLNFT